MSATRLVKQSSYESGKKRGHVRMGTFGPWNPEIYDGMFPSDHYPPSKHYARDTPHYSRSTNPTSSSRNKTRFENPAGKSSSATSTRELGECHPLDTFGNPDQGRAHSGEPASRQSSSIGDEKAGSEIIGRARTLSSTSQTSASAKSSRSEPQASSSKPQAATGLPVRSLANSSAGTSRSVGGRHLSIPRKILQNPTPTMGPSPEALSRTPLESMRLRPTQLPDGPRPRNPPSHAHAGDTSIPIPVRRHRRLEEETDNRRPSSAGTLTGSPLDRAPPSPSRRRLTILLPEASSSRVRTNSRPSTPGRPLPVAIDTGSPTSISRSPRAVNGVLTNPRGPELKASLSHPNSLENVGQKKPQSPIRENSPGPPPSFTNPFASSKPIPIPRLDTSMHGPPTQQSPPSSNSHPFEATFLQSPTSDTGPSVSFSDAPTFTNPFASSPWSTAKATPRVLNGPRSRNGTSSPSSQSPISPTSASRLGVLPPQPPLPHSAAPIRQTSSPLPRRTSLQVPADSGDANAYRKTSLPNFLDTISEGLPSKPEDQYASWGRSSMALALPIIRSPTPQEQRVGVRKWSQKIGDLF